MTSNHHAPYDLGYTRATMDGSEGGEAARWSETQKPVHSSDCSLQLDCTKLESLVIANQHVAVNTFSGLVQEKRRCGYCLVLSVSGKMHSRQEH